MNRLQRRNQRILANTIKQPVLVTSIDISKTRLVSAHTAAWEDYWGCHDFANEKLNRLQAAWHAFISSGYAAQQRHQFSLSDYFQGIRTIMEEKTRCCDEDTIYAVLRYFDETSLVLPQGGSLIGELAKTAGTILIEDSDLTAKRLRRHLEQFALNDLRVKDLSGYRGRHGASVAFITKRHPSKGCIRS
jgi:hypothetical protein